MSDVAAEFSQLPALKLGAKHATAIDIDEVAVKVAAENMAVNHIPSSDYTLYDGDLISNAFLKVKAELVTISW